MEAGGTSPWQATELKPNYPHGTGLHCKAKLIKIPKI
jgi:hypothetical protein